MDKELLEYTKKDTKRVSKKLKKFLESSDDKEFLEWACFHPNTYVAEAVLCRNRNIPPSIVEDVLCYGPRMTSLFLTEHPKKNYVGDTLHRNISRVYGYRLERLFMYNCKIIPISTLIKSTYIQDFVSWNRCWALKIYLQSVNHLASYIMLPRNNCAKSHKTPFGPNNPKQRRLKWFK